MTKSETWQFKTLLQKSKLCRLRENLHGIYPKWGLQLKYMKHSYNSSKINNPFFKIRENIWRDISQIERKKEFTDGKKKKKTHEKRCNISYS